MIANKEMTPAHREMADSLLDSINEHFIGTIAQARNLDAAKVQAIIDQCPTSVHELIEAGLADGAKYLEDLHEELGGDETPLVPMRDYASVSPESQRLGIGPRIAVVYAVGGIVAGESGSSVQGQTLGARTLSQALREAAEDEDIKAIVLRVDSPGGSALASDLVWRATQSVKKSKPVIVSMSDVAGSGGYYIAAGATRIVAQPTTLTGSIGVVFARPGIERLLNNLGVNTETITRGRFAGLDAATTPMTPEGRAKLIAEMQNIYDVFVRRVAEGRKLSLEDVDQIGRGRVWTGAQAKEKGLVDEIGGLQMALQAAKQAAGIDSAQEVKLVFYPRRQSLLERVSSALEARTVNSLPAPVGAVAARLGWLGEGGVLAHMPQIIEIR
jgi:protease-4